MVYTYVLPKSPSIRFSGPITGTVLPEQYTSLNGFKVSKYELVSAEPNLSIAARNRQMYRSFVRINEPIFNFNLMNYTKDHNLSNFTHGVLGFWGFGVLGPDFES